MRYLACLLVLGTASLCSASVVWTAFTVPGGEFRVMFPSQVVVQGKHMTADNNISVAYQTYYTHAEDVTCVVTSCAIPKGMNAQEQNRFTLALAEGYRANNGFQNLQQSARTFGSLRGEYVSLTSEGQQFGIWVVTYRDHVYALSYSAPRSKYLQTEGAFFSSFHVNQIPPSRGKSKGSKAG